VAVCHQLTASTSSMDNVILAMDAIKDVNAEAESGNVKLSDVIVLRHVDLSMDCLRAYLLTNAGKIMEVVKIVAIGTATLMRSRALVLLERP